MKKVQVVYDWKPPVCSHCKVFGHSYEACLKRVRTEETTKEKQADEEGFLQANKRKDNHVPGSSKVTQQPKANLPKDIVVKSESDCKAQRPKNRYSEKRKKSAGYKKKKAQGCNKL